MFIHHLEYIDMKKSSTKEIFETIFRNIGIEAQNISELSYASKIPNKTIKKYVELIEFIQSQPKIALEKTGHTCLVKKIE